MVDAYRVVPCGYVSYNSKDSFTRKVSGEALDAGCTPAIRVVSRLGSTSTVTVQDYLIQLDLTSSHIRDGLAKINQTITFLRINTERVTVMERDADRCAPLAS